MFIQVQIIETIILGVAAYSCKCVNCGWKSKAFEKENSAVSRAKKHLCKGVK